MEWINIRDKLPPDTYSDYLCHLIMDNQGNYAIWHEVLWWDWKNKKWCENNPSTCYKKDIRYINDTREGWHSVTYWMPLPNAPEEDK